MTYRERRMRKAERLRDWADKRRAKSSAAFNRASTLADAIPMGQPILIGHHSEKRHRRDVDRIHTSMSKGVEHQRKAEEMTGRAAGIEDQASRAIYRDDANAVEQLQARIAELERRRERMKTINKTIRSGSGWESRLVVPLTEAEKLDLLNAARYSNTIGYPAYALQNLSGNLLRQRKRLPQLEAEATQRQRVRETLAEESVMAFDTNSAIRERLALLAEFGPTMDPSDWGYHSSKDCWYYCGAALGGGPLPRRTSMRVKQEGSASLELIQSRWQLDRRSAMAFIGYPEPR